MAVKKEKPNKTVGHPPINKPDDTKAIQKKIDDYFDGLQESEEGEKEKPTFCGLALALGYCSRQQLWNRVNEDVPIALPIKKATLRIEESYEKQLRTNSPTGAIFALKNRGWKDKPDDEAKDETISRLLLIAEKLTGTNADK
jgi:hypothetical protein